jgi:hypothetical protein
MSRTLQFTLPDEIGTELEQYIYGKYGVAPPKALGQMVLSQMSKNPLTVQQCNRIVKRYGKDAVVSLDLLAVPLKIEKTWL